MKTFLKWAEANQMDFVQEEQAKLEENAKRTGMTANYPDIYKRGQYPDLANIPHKATAALDLQQKPNPKYGGQRAAN